MLQPLISPSQLSQLLTSIRKVAGITQEELAARIGVSQSRLSKMERSADGWSVEQMFNACQALGLELQIQFKAHADAGSASTSQSKQASVPTSAPTDW